jgi:hypothetical protein
MLGITGGGNDCCRHQHSALSSQVELFMKLRLPEDQDLFVLVFESICAFFNCFDIEERIDIFYLKQHDEMHEIDVGGFINRLIQVLSFVNHNGTDGTKPVSVSALCPPINVLSALQLLTKFCSNMTIRTILCSFLNTTS